ncbi:hypothetical protein [Shewanella algae]|uniref:hypothetical protein n=1 Tax=Shewanella algae TaxID=38313 RepID=UPI001AAFE512|nr:hypothetical protein [Shewanella algae]MBO2661643.1 hypothetical protein [Shewanella algae]MCL1055114.1 hypothetical protein [Shewanella algae]
MDPKVVGAWIVHHSNKLQTVSHQPQYSEIAYAGKLGKLMSAITSDSRRVLSKSHVESLAVAANIDKYSVDGCLQKLSENKLVDVSDGQVSVIGLTGAAVLSHVDNIFRGLSPSDGQKAVIELAELSSGRPRTGTELKEYLGDTYKISSANVSQLMSDSEGIGFVDYELLNKNENLYYNGNIFRRDNPKKVYNVLSALSQSEVSLTNQINEELKSKGCLSVEYVKKVLGDSLFSKLAVVGLYDVNVVSNSKEQAGFVTLPSAFTKYTDPLVDDAFDLAKAFVSSITYGMTKSYWERGRIQDVTLLVGSLIRGNEIGPVPAIGQDYRILELKGVVSVRQGEKNGRKGPMMKLLKKEIGELALTVLTQGTASEDALTELTGSSVTSYTGPETNRVRIKKDIDIHPYVKLGLLDALRSGGM